MRIIYPSDVPQRLVVQSGHFTIHDFPWTDLRRIDPDSLDPANLDIVAVKKVVIPAGAKGKLDRELMRASINSRTLFPDLDGLTKGLVELEAIREFG